ncbi:MAG TPA: MBL fold metallo-hydrolase [Candidatus Margulisiibacteriota bacterium]|nr:MBL fold metallo-hydrolase [Candidatus Margulisiibacteriota bacterium]
MKVTYIGHACILLESAGTRILMDPWLTDPTYHGTWWHYPPLALGPRDLPKLDYLYISHEHMDHFDPPTLRQLDKDVHVIIANFKRKRFRDRIAALGFSRITEVDFGRDFRCNGSGLTVRLIPPDRTWDDSAILVKDGSTTVLNVNDCHLDDATLGQLGREHQIDLAFLTFTGASQYPGCFEFPLRSKLQRWRESKESHLEEFVSWARLLRTKRAVPAAGNFALLAPDQLFMNTPHYVSTPQEAIERLRVAAPQIEGVQMNPGDVWTSDGSLTRLHPAPDWSRRLEQIEDLSRQHGAQIAEGFASEGEAPADLYERFHAYFTALLQADPSIAPRVNIVTWWVVDGAHGGDWVIDFTRERDWVYRGVPSCWNLRLKFPARLVYQGVSGDAIWDNLVLSFRLRLARNPDRYNKEFWTWLCKL